MLPLCLSTWQRFFMYQGCLGFDYATFYSRSQSAVIRVYDDAGNVIETHGHTGAEES
jgi:hypothetical protein